MGVIIKEPIELMNGLSINDAYAAIGNSKISITKDQESNKITVWVFFSIWKDLASRNDKKAPLMEMEVNIKYDTAPVTNIYELLYTEFKTMKNCDDSN
jgi:hypothetical protein|tara:strand:- start:691 stop:984 length:294 start_codon:yes stop_codon:yes gene_type:complete